MIDKRLLCPECKKPLTAYRDFFACAEFHRHWKDITGGLTLGIAKNSHVSVARRDALKEFTSRHSFGFIADALADELKENGDILLYEVPVFNLVERMAALFPDRTVFSLISEKRIHSLSKSRGNLMNVCGTTEDIADNSFSAVVTFSKNPKFAAHSLEKNGVIVRIFPSPVFLREAFAYGFPAFSMPKPAIGFTEIKRLKISSRPFFSASDLSTVYSLCYPKIKNAPPGFSEFPEQFVHLDFIVSFFVKK